MVLTICCPAQQPSSDTTPNGHPNSSTVSHRARASRLSTLEARRARDSAPTAARWGPSLRRALYSPFARWGPSLAGNGRRDPTAERWGPSPRLALHSLFGRWGPSLSGTADAGLALLPARARCRPSFLRSTKPPSMGPFTLLRESLLRSLIRALIRLMVMLRLP